MAHGLYAAASVMHCFVGDYRGRMNGGKLARLDYGCTSKVEPALLALYSGA